MWISGNVMKFGFCPYFSIICLGVGKAMEGGLVGWSWYSTNVLKTSWKSGWTRIQILHGHNAGKCDPWHNCHVFLQGARNPCEWKEGFLHVHPKFQTWYFKPVDATAFLAYPGSKQQIHRSLFLASGDSKYSYGYENAWNMNGPPTKKWPI